MGKMRVGLALGEGGARGLVHIGVLQVFHEEDIEVSIIAGSSIGAIIGAMYAETMDPFEVHKRFKEVIESELYHDTGISSLLTVEDRDARFWDQISSRIKGTIALTLASTKMSLLSSENLKKVIDALIRVEEFSQLHIPLMVVATDLKGGREVVLCVGDLKRAVLASASIPGFFSPVRYKDYLLSDGAISCPVPVKYCAGSPRVLKVCVAVPPILSRMKHLDNALEVVMRSEEINMYYFTREMIKDADVALVPDIGDIKWNDFHRIDELVEIGRNVAKEKIPEIKKREGKISSFFNRLFSSKDPGKTL